MTFCCSLRPFSFKTEQWTELPKPNFHFTPFDIPHFACELSGDDEIVAISNFGRFNENFNNTKIFNLTSLTWRNGPNTTDMGQPFLSRLVTVPFGNTFLLLDADEENPGTILEWDGPKEAWVVRVEKMPSVLMNSGVVVPQDFCVQEGGSNSASRQGVATSFSLLLKGWLIMKLFP